MSQLYQARRTATTVDDQYRNQNELHIEKINHQFHEELRVDGNREFVEHH